MTKHNSYLTIDEMVAMPLLYGVHMSEDGQSVLVNNKWMTFPPIHITMKFGFGKGVKVPRVSLMWKM